MKLMALSIENFKGIRAFDHRFDGRNADIYGRNGSGKTTIQDAVLWLLFGRDSSERADFSIKPLDREGQVMNHGAETCVKAVIEHGKKLFSLRKVYREKWTKQRGSADEIFTGHECMCFVDDVPVSARSYADTIGGMIDEKVFRAITNVKWFASQKWQERRELLFRMGGDLTSDELFSGNLEPLRGMLQGRTVEDYRKVLQVAMRGYNKDLSDLPIRIDEAQRGIDRSVEDGEDVEAAIAAATDQLRVMDVPNRADELALQRANLTVEMGRLDAENRIYKQNQLMRAAEVRGNRRHALKLDHDEARRVLADLYRTIDYYTEEIKSADGEAANLKAEWEEAEEEQWEGAEFCPTCERPLPLEQIKRSMENWEKFKTDRLDRIDERGKSVVAKREEAIQKASSAQDKVGATLERIEKLSVQIAGIDQEPAFVPADLPGYSDRLRVLQDQQRALDLEIAEAQKQADPSAQARRMDVHAKLSALESKRQARRRNDETRLRIEELRAKHKQVAAAYEQAAYALTLCEEYTRRHMALTEARINGLFRMVKWKLFEEQVNGGIADTCIPTVDGVPYADLNNAAKVNAGIDIINTLSRFYGVTAPIFIDNAESVTQLLPMDAQVIRLVVSEHDPVLRVA